MTKKTENPDLIHITLSVPLIVTINRNDLLGYADSIRERWGEPDLNLFEIEDLLIQAGLDGDLELPEEWHVENFDYPDGLTWEDLEAMAGDE